MKNVRKSGDYYITGDLAHIDEDGYFWFEGRRDDIIISSGYTIGPFEVEDALTNHPAVKECAVVASPHEIRGNIVKAFVILQDNYQGNDDLVKELQTFAKNEVAPYKYPRAIEFVDSLPKTNSGKTVVLNYAMLNVRNIIKKMDLNNIDFNVERHLVKCFGHLTRCYFCV